MTAPWLGCIADDYTGATDLSSALVRAGLRVVQMFDLPKSESLPSDIDAVVIALKSRSVPVDEAIHRSITSLRMLQSFGIERFYFKYCSTFDSLPTGNIGPVAEALADELRTSAVWYCPAYPENGRTVERGHLFVDGVPLNESGMQHHPLNPMTDSNLVNVLQAQCRGTVGLKGLTAVREKRLSASGESNIRHWILDAISADDLRSIAEQASGHQLLTGGSALARYWAESLVRNAPRPPADFTPTQRDRVRSGPNERDSTVLILAGSCSAATRAQVAAFADMGPVLHLEVAKADDQTIERASRWFHDQAGRRAALIVTGAEPGSVEAALRAWGSERASEIAESLLAGIASRLAAKGVTTIIVAGGETSGAVVRALGVHSCASVARSRPEFPGFTRSIRRTSIWPSSRGTSDGRSSFVTRWRCVYERTRTP